MSKKRFDTIIEGMKVEGNGKTLVYRYRGVIERDAGGKYVWRNGYSLTTADGGVLYPWMTRRACQAEAKRYGKKAVFIDAWNREEK